jgi:hypothetical protein
MFGLSCVISLQAQSTNASLTGRVTDPTRAVLSEAKVIVINTGTGVRYQGITNQTGSYYVTDLPPGRYRIEVEKIGFKAVIKSALTLHVQDALEVNFEMVLGSALESVMVENDTVLLDTESSTMGTVVEQRKANELPLNGRNVFNLIELAPSVVPRGVPLVLGRRESIWMGQLSSKWLVREPECGIPGRATFEHRLHQFTRAHSHTGLDSGVQGANQQSGSGMG